jgi:hypothetical protein
MIEDEIHSINKLSGQNIRFLLCDTTGNVRQDGTQLLAGAIQRNSKTILK